MLRHLEMQHARCDRDKGWGAGGIHVYFHLERICNQTYPDFIQYVPAMRFAPFDFL